MALTNYESNLLRILDRYVTRYLRKRMTEALRNSVVDTALMKVGSVKNAPRDARKQLQEFVPWLNSLVPPLTSKNMSGPPTGLVSRCIYAKSAKVELDAACKDVIRMMQRDAAAISMECMLPPPRRSRQVKVPRTPLEARREKLQDKAKEWERKLKYATTKLKKYKSRIKRCVTMIENQNKEQANA